MYPTGKPYAIGREPCFRLSLRSPANARRDELSAARHLPFGKVAGKEYDQPPVAHFSLMAPPRKVKHQLHGVLCRDIVSTLWTKGNRGVIEQAGLLVWDVVRQVWQLLFGMVEVGPVTRQSVLNRCFVQGFILRMGQHGCESTGGLTIRFCRSSQLLLERREVDRIED
jgi:hypothetical protein